MDELKDKFKSLLKPSKKFKGQGQKLGTAEAKPQAHQAAVAASSSGAGSHQKPVLSQQQPAAGTSSSSGSNHPNLQHSRATAAVTRVEPRQELKPATEFSPFTAVIGEPIGYLFVQSISQLSIAFGNINCFWQHQITAAESCNSHQAQDR
jgi:hypothetical protein